MGLTDFLAAGLNLIGANETNDAQYRQQKRQREWEEHMVEKQNEYNSPVNQMKRLEEAGINPASTFMSGATSVSGNTSASPNSVGLAPLENPVTAATNAFLLSKQAANLEAKTKTENQLRDAQYQNLLAQNKQTLANAELIGLNAANQKTLNEFTAAKETWFLRNEKAKFNLTFSQRNQVNQQIKSMKYELENILPEQLKLLVQQGKLNVLDMDRVVAELESIKANTEKTKAETELTQAKTDTEGITQNNLIANTQLTYEEYEKVKLDVEKYLDRFNAEIAEIQARTGLTNEETYWYAFKVVQDGQGYTKLPAAFGQGWRQSRINREYKRALDKYDK